MVEILTYRSPLEMIHSSPATLSAEVITHTTFLLCLIHASTNGAEHTLLLFITLCAASAVDPFCLISPQLRNYYHDHASLLAWDRHVAPWQFTLFANLAYLGTAAVWRLKLPLKIELAAVAVVCSYTFYPADQFFCKWMVYQWHDQDPLYADRNGAGSGQCVPCGSSMWVMAYSMCGSLLARLAVRYDITNIKTLTFSTRHNVPLISYSREWWSKLVVCILIFLPGHIFPVFPLFYAPIAMLYGDAALAVQLFFGGCSVVTVLYMIMARQTRQTQQTQQALQARQSQQNPITKKPVGTMWLVGAGVVWFGGLAAVGVFLDPSEVRSYSIHQPYGGKNAVESSLCSEQETYLYGLPGAVRKKYQCEEDFRFWTLCDGEAEPSLGADTYALCGTKGDEAFWYEYFSSILIGVGLNLFCWCYWSIFSSDFSGTCISDQRPSLDDKKVK